MHGSVQSMLALHANVRLAGSDEGRAAVERPHAFDAGSVIHLKLRLARPKVQHMRAVVITAEKQQRWVGLDGAA